MSEPVGSLATVVAPEEATAVALRSPAAYVGPWWRQAFAYVAAGLRICSKDIPGLLSLVGLFSVPPLVAVLVGEHAGPGVGGTIAYWVSEALPWITITLGNISAVLAVEAIDDGERVVPHKILPAAFYWLPRYLVANGITTVLFWGIFTPASLFIDVQLQQRGVNTFFTLLILLIPALFWHVRLVFATYAAIVDDMSGPRSVLISFGIVRHRWAMAVVAFVASVAVAAPIALPAYILIQIMPNPLVANGYEWVLTMAIRPLFIATLHEIYEDFRPAKEIAERQRQSQLSDQARRSRWSWLHI
ncbi:MAG TPA: hypothetical protein VKB76_09235 [Ktedonobacterales bacterium]|nr:hypothetical protein [Ktedonobacterales bacterium]